MRGSTLGAVAAAAVVLFPSATYAATGTFTDAIRDARRVHDGVVTKGVTGDSDITGITVRAGRSEDDQREIRVQVKVREIDRSSNSGSHAGKGLATRAVLTLDTGLKVTVTGQPRGYTVGYEGDLSCFAPEDELEPFPDLRYGRYTDTITITIDGGCFDDAETASVKVRTTSLRNGSRLIDWAATEPVVLGDDDTA